MTQTPADESKLIDFDAYRREQKRVPVLFTIGGQTYELPPSLPASVAVDVIRMKKTMSDDEDVDPIKLLDFCKAVFGEELWVSVLAEHRLTLDEIPDLLGMVLEKYTDPKAVANLTSRVTRGSSDS